jgi:protein-tyrosine phosphatase
MEGRIIPHPTIHDEESDPYQEIIQEPNKCILLGSINARKYIEHLDWVIEILEPNETGHSLPPNVRVYRFEFDDKRTIQLAPWLDIILPIIRNETGRGLIHCREGRSRSPSILIAYLIRYHHMTYEEALTLLQSKRPIVRPNPGFAEQLRTPPKPYPSVSQVE